MKIRRAGRPAPGGAFFPVGEWRLISLLFLVIVVALLCLARFALGGVAKLWAAENAISTAREAARVGAEMADRSTVYPAGTCMGGQAQAIAAARAYLAAAGKPGTVTAAGPGAIQVTVTITGPSAILSLIDAPPVTATGEATVNLVTGALGTSGAAGSSRGPQGARQRAAGPGG